MTQPKNTIRTFALVCVAVTSAFIMYMAWWHTDILSAPDWCGRAINAEKLSSARATSAVELCKDLLLAQVKAVSTDSHIYGGSLAMCLAVLMVIVVAGGRVSFKASKSGVETDISRDDEDPPVQVQVVNQPDAPVPVEAQQPEVKP